MNYLGDDFVKLNSFLKNYNFIGGWEENGIVYLWYRDDNGNRKIINVFGVPRYFAIEMKNYSKATKSQWEEWKSENYFRYGTKVGDYGIIYTDFMGRKNEWDNWLTELDNLGIKPLEADINRLQRLMIDMELKVAPLGKNGPKVAFYDIETDDRIKGKIVIGGSRILSFSYKADDGRERFFAIKQDTDMAEKEFLKLLVTELTQFDILVGYNNYAFDDEYIEKRLLEFDMQDAYKKFRRIATLDLFNLFQRQGTFGKYKVKDKKLETIAQAVLGRGKVTHEKDIFETWRDDIELLERYNKEDVRLLFDLENKLGVVGLIQSICSVSGLLHSTGYSPAKAIDQMMLRKAVARRNIGLHDFRYPTSFYRPEHKIGGMFNKGALSSDKRKGRKEILAEEFDIEDYEEVTGGLVLDTIPGLYDKVYFADFNSLYPNTIRAFNIGHDTVTDNPNLPNNRALNGVLYRTDMVSALSENVDVLLNERAKIRGQLKLETDPIKKKAFDLLQKAVKELTNSFYGAMAQWGSRYYSKEIAESITSGGRTFLPFGVEYFTARGHKIVLGDTDSLAFSLSDNTDPNTIVNDYIISLKNKIKTENNVYRPDVLKMSVEKAFKPMLVIAKKNYIGWKVMEDGIEITPDEPTIMGIRVKKSNFPVWSGKICMRILSDLLSGIYKNIEHYKNILDEEKQRLSDGKVPIEELLISARLGKPLNDYTGKNPLIHVRLAKHLAEKGIFIGEYSTISYLVTNGGVPQDAIAEQELDVDSKPDIVYYWDKILLSQVDDYLGIVFPEFDWTSYKFPKIKKPRKKKVPSVKQVEELINA